MEEKSLCVGPTKTHTTDVIEDIIVPIVVSVLMLSIIVPFTLASLCVTITLIKDIIALL